MVWNPNGVSAAILAGGLGTRLRSVVVDRPKVLAEVAGRPFLAHLLDQLAAAGIRKTVLLTGYAADQVHATFGDRYAEITLKYSVESRPLGTGGALRLALPHLAESTVLLLNGDSYCEVDIPLLVADHRQFDGDATLSLAWVEAAGRYGRVQIEKNNRVTHFAEKDSAETPGWINAGVYAVKRDRIAEIPPDRPMSFEREIIPEWVAGGKVLARPAGRFIDIGTPESYAEAETFFQSCRH
jgi:D-glycero-alpha-D-manno-heptose 1-phosphate guanylyltransferase